MSKNSMPPTIATLLIAAFVHNTAFAQAANYQPYQSTGRLVKPPRNVRIRPKNTLGHKRVTQVNSYCQHGVTDPDPESVSSLPATADGTKKIRVISDLAIARRVLPSRRCNIWRLTF
jgi:hypothetical protein